MTCRACDHPAELRGYCARHVERARHSELTPREAFARLDRERTEEARAAFVDALARHDLAAR